jgi:hypothetical protein
MATSFVFITPPATNTKLLTFDNYGSPEAVSFNKMLEYIDKQIIKMYCELQDTFTTNDYINAAITRKIREISSNLLIENKILQAQLAIIDKYNSEFVKKTGKKIDSLTPVQTGNSREAILAAKLAAMNERASALNASMSIDADKNDKSAPKVLEYGTKITLRLVSGNKYLQINDFMGDFVQLLEPGWGEGSKLQWIISK